MMGLCLNGKQDLLIPGALNWNYSQALFYVEYQGLAKDGSALYDVILQDYEW